MRRTMVIIAAVVLVGASCGGDGPGLAEYAEQGEMLVRDLQMQLDAIDRVWESRPPSPEGAQAYWDRRLEARRAFTASLRSLRPPRDYADVHASYLEIFTRLIAAEQALADRVTASATVSGHWVWRDTAEGRAARAVELEAIAACHEAQEYLDATQERPNLADAAWIPPEMSEVVRVRFACSDW